MQSKITNKLITKEKMKIVEQGIEGLLTGTIKWITGRDIFNTENIIILNFG